MKSQSTMISATNSTSTPAKRTLFRIALSVTMIGTVVVSVVLILNGGLALHRLRTFTDVGLHSRYLTAILILIFGLLSLSALIILVIGLIKVNKTLAIVAAVLLGICSLGLIVISVWSFLIITGGQLAASINSTIIKELDQTYFRISTGNEIIIENTAKMAKIEKQHHCCGLTEPIDDYRSRQAALFGSSHSSSSSGGSYNKGKASATQRNTAASGSSVHLPISCCNEKFRSEDNLCIDAFGNHTNPINRYNIVGCYGVVARYKFERIQKQGFATVITACLAVISCIALAAVVRLLGEGYQVVPLRITK